jgi:hypothetical protein
MLPPLLDFAWTNERRIRLPAHLNGHQLTALLDSGSVQTGVNWAAAKQVSVTQNTTELTQRNTIVGGDGTPWVVHEYRFSEMRIGSLLWSRFSLVLADVNALQDIQVNRRALLVAAGEQEDHQIFALAYYGSDKVKITRKPCCSPAATRRSLLYPRFSMDTESNYENVTKVFWSML